MLELSKIPYLQIVPPSNPMRVSMDDHALEELAESIRGLGLLQPIIVRPARVIDTPTDGEAPTRDAALSVIPVPRYEVVAGHRRYLACGIARVDPVPCLVLNPDGISCDAVMLHENIEREDVSAAEEGWKFCEMAERFADNEAAFVAAIGKPAGYIYARMRLVQADENVAKANAQRKINFSVAIELLKCQRADYREMLLDRAIAGGATAHQMRMWVRDVNLSAPPVAPAPAVEGEAPPAPVVGYEVDPCIVCGQSHAPYLLRQLNICVTEIDFVKQVIEKMREVGRV